MRRLSAFAAALPLALALAGAPSGPSAQEGAALVGPRLAAASNFSQGDSPNLLRYAGALGVDDFRDGMAWGRAERAPGRPPRFSGQRLAYPDRLAAVGIDVGIVLNWGNPIYDDGDTPHTPEGIAAFGRFAADVAVRFPDLDHLEIGNEFNGTNFVRGPVAEMSPSDRARAYARLLESAATQVRDVRPDLRLLGGATHSIPAGWLWEVLDAGGAAHMDALAIHPYTTPPEQLVRQLEVLRRHPDAAALPIEVTEFGDTDPARVAGHLMRNYCQMALAGVTRAVWYPLNARGDDLVPLVTPEGRITAAGRAWRLAAERMEGRAVVDIAPDPFTYGCRFAGSDGAGPTDVIWGLPRPYAAPEGARVLDAEGAPRAAPHLLSETDPLVVLHAADAPPPPLAARTDVAADSYHQFAYPGPDGAAPDGDGFDRFARRLRPDGRVRRIDLATLPGQQAPGTPWFPYRGSSEHRALRLTAESLIPGGRADAPVEIVHAYTAPADEVLDLRARFDLPRRSVDGVTVRVTVDGETLLDRTGGAGGEAVDADLDAIALAAGQVLEVAVGPNADRRGDVARHRITLLRRP